MNSWSRILLLASVGALFHATPAGAWPGGVDCATEGGPGLSVRAGANCRALRFDGSNRRYVAWVSPAAQRAMRRGRRVPMVVMLHGAAGTGEDFLDKSGWREKANREGFVAVFPTGLRYRVDEVDPPRMSTRWAYYLLENGIDETVDPAGRRRRLPAGRGRRRLARRAHRPPRRVPVRLLRGRRHVHARGAGAHTRLPRLRLQRRIGRRPEPDAPPGRSPAARPLHLREPRSQSGG